MKKKKKAPVSLCAVVLCLLTAVPPAVAQTIKVTYKGGQPEKVIAVSKAEDNQVMIIEKGGEIKFIRCEKIKRVEEMYPMKFSGAGAYGAAGTTTGMLTGMLTGSLIGLIPGAIIGGIAGLIGYAVAKSKPNDITEQVCPGCFQETVAAISAKMVEASP